MKPQINTLLVILLITFCQLNAQEFNGIATYKTKRKMDVQVDSTKAHDAMYKQMIASFKKQYEKTYLLEFNQFESLFKEDEELVSPAQSSGMSFSFAVPSSSGSIYVNLKDKRYVDERELYGKKFLIKDEIIKTQWKLSNETKNIGEYRCHKATMVKEISNTMYDRNNKEVIKNSKVNVTAWYTTDIPVSLGPRLYSGLPGLILEVNDGIDTIICSRIVLNPSTKIELKEPKKGKKVSQKKYNGIVKEKNEEFRKKNPPRNNRESTFEINVNGSN